VAKRGVSRTRKDDGLSPAQAKKERVLKKSRRRKNLPASQLRTVTDPTTGAITVMQAYDEYPDEFRYIAKMLYLTGQATPAEISQRMGIPLGTVRSWSQRDKWTALRRNVARIANKDMVKAARRAMSNYMKDIDRGLNTILETLNARMLAVPADKQLDNEGQIVRYLLDVWRLKISLVRTLTYGVHGKAFFPHPSNLTFDDTAEEPTAMLFGEHDIEELLQVIPAYMQQAARLVIGVGPEDLSEEMLDAVQMRLDEVEEEQKEREKESKEARAKQRREQQGIEEWPEGLDPVEDVMDIEEDDDE